MLHASPCLEKYPESFPSFPSMCALRLRTISTQKSLSPSTRMFHDLTSVQTSQRLAKLVSQVLSHILRDRCAQLHSVGIGNEAGYKGVVEHKWLNSHTCSISTLRRHSEGMNFLGIPDLTRCVLASTSCIGSTGLPIKWGGELSGYRPCSISWSSQEQSRVWRMSLCVNEGCDSSSLPLTAGRNVAEYFAPSRNVYGIVKINVSPRACIFMGNQAQMVHLHSPGLLKTLAPTSLCARISLKCLSLWPNLRSLYVKYGWTGKR